MAGLQRVSWRTVGYAVLSFAVAAAAVTAVIRRDGVRPTSLESRAVTHWLLHRNADATNDLILADGLSSRVIARINPASDTNDEVAVQGPAGAFLVAPRNGTVRAISTSGLQLGTAQLVTTLAVPGAKFGVGTAGLTVVAADAAEVVAANDVSRPLEIPAAANSLIAADGSVWSFAAGTATHVNVDESRESIAVPTELRVDNVTTVGADAVWFDRANETVHWLRDAASVSVAGVTDASSAVLQQPSDESSAVWLAIGDQLLQVTRAGVVTSTIAGLGMRPDDELAVSGMAAVAIRSASGLIERIDLGAKTMAAGGAVAAPEDAALTVSADAGLVWIDDADGANAWVVNPFGVVVIDKSDTSAPLFDASGEVDSREPSDGDSEGGQGTGGTPDALDRTDPNPGADDPPTASPDSVTARAGITISIPVTVNDFDPEGGAIAVSRVGRAGHGSTSNVDGASVSYQPESAYSGTDEFDYTIVDEGGHEATTTVRVRLFAADSPNQPPLTQPDIVETRAGRSVTIDVLANDIDPERDVLAIPTFQQLKGATITDGVSQSGLVALQFDPPPDARPGEELHFTYVAADPQGGVSEPTEVTVKIISPSTANRPPIANPDSARAAIGGSATVQVTVNDVDPDDDPLSISPVGPLPVGVRAAVRDNSLTIAVEPGAAPRSVVIYDLSDGAGHHVNGRVLVLRVDEAVSNQPPIANPDVQRVVVGNSVLVPVVRNDSDPEGDTIRLVGASQPGGGTGKTEVEGDSVRFTPNLPGITEPTNVDFDYEIDDGHGNRTTGFVTVTVLANALPRAPFARDDSATTVENKPVTIDVLANDSDPSGGVPSLLDDPACVGGVAIRTIDDRVLYTPPNDQTGTFRCKYVVVNAQGLRREASIVITVTPSVDGNTEPTLIRPGLSLVASAGKPLLVSVDSVALDADADPLTFTFVGQPTQGSTSLSPSATTLVYTPPATTTLLNDAFTIVVSDGRSTVRGQISVLVRADPSAGQTPSEPRALDLNGSTRIDTRKSFNVPTLISEANPGMTIVLLGATLTSGSAAVESSAATGIVSITPNSPDTVTVRYRVANAADLQLTSEATISVTVVVPTPLVPSVAVADAVQLHAGEEATLDLIANDDIRLDPGEQVRVTLGRTLPAQVGTASVNNLGTDFHVSVLPTADAGTYELTYTLDDGGSSSSASITVTVLACTDAAPKAITGQGFTPYQQPYSIDLTAGLPGNVSVVPGSVVGGGLLGPIGTYTPPAGMNDNVVITYAVANRCGQTAPGVFTLDVNRAPRMTDVSAVASVGSSITIPLADITVDDEPLSTQLVGAPSWVSVGPSGVIASPPGGTAHVPTVFTLVVTDPGGLVGAATVSIDVANRAPQAVVDSYSTTQALLTFDPTDNDTDPDGDHLTVQSVSWVNGSGSISVNDNLVTVDVAHGVSQLSYTITDGELTATSTITITSNSAPTIENESRSTEETTFDVHLHVNDVDDDPLVVTCESTTNLAVEVIGFRLVITVLNAFIGVDNFACTVTDALSATATATITIEILS
ncbi:MAG: Ig-like domain-containing protein [Ilumatobacteraceae bacterium]